MMKKLWKQVLSLELPIEVENIVSFKVMPLYPTVHGMILTSDLENYLIVCRFKRSEDMIKYLTKTRAKEVMSTLLIENSIEPTDRNILLFGFLHEIGHVYSFMNKTEKEIDENYYLQKSGMEKLQNELQKGKINYIHAQLEYRKFPLEKEADDFALEHLSKLTQNRSKAIV